MSSQSSLNTKSRALVLFEQFRQCAPPEVKQKLPREWAELGAEELCDTAVWDGFAKYLSEIYVIERGGHREGQPLLAGHRGREGVVVFLEDAVEHEARARYS